MMSRPSRIRKGLPVAGALVALVVLGGCSTSSGSSPATTTTGSTSAGPAGPTTSASAATSTGATTSASATASTTSTSASTSTTTSPPATSPTGSASTSSASGGTPECRSADLKLTLAPGNGTAGTVYTAVQFTNTGARSCLIVGFPGVSYVTSENGTQVGAAAAREGSPGPAVVLHPGQMASAVVGMVDVGVFSSSSCVPTPVAGLRVYPPDETVSMFVAHKGTGCAGTPPDPQLTVRTVKAGSGTP